MLFSPKLIALIFGGAGILGTLIFIAPINLIQGLLFLVVYNGVLALLVMIDWYITPKSDVFTLHRIYEHRLSIGAENPVTVQIRNHGKYPLDVTIKDEPPHEFKISTKILKKVINANGIEEFKYLLTPHKRGDYKFGQINVRYKSKLGLLFRQFNQTGENQLIKVYPNIMDIRKYQILAHRGHLLEAGIKASKVVGLGTEFESLRDYQIDDEFRRINWGATARRGKLVSNQYEVEKSQNILLVLDAGRMMSGEVHGLSKFDYAINAALLLGYVSVTKGDKVGLVAFADDVKLLIPPGKGQHQLQKILGSLYNILPHVVESDYAKSFQYISTKNRKRSLICVFTDLIDEDASKRLITYISSLTTNHLVVCITLTDTTLLEKARKVPVDSQEVYEKGVAQAIIHSRVGAINRLKNRGIIVVDVPPEELSIATINKYLEIKGLGRL